MSKTQAPPQMAPARAGSKTAIWLIGGLVVFVMLVIGLGSPSLLLFMLIGFAPTLAAGIIDQDKEKHSAIAVGAMSLAAMIPLVLAQLTERSGSTYNVLGDTWAWMKVYGCATIGWLIHTGVPNISVMMSDFRTTWRQEDLKKLQDKLIEEWGQEVVSKKKPS